MMVTPLPVTRSRNALAVAATNKQCKQQQQPPPTDLAFSTRAMSPIKKHLKNAANVQWTKQVTAAPSPTRASGSVGMPATNFPATNMGVQRAAIVQVMLGLLDGDEETVHGTIPILQALAQLPLESPTTRRECLVQLQRLGRHASSSPSKRLQPYDPHFDAASDIPTSTGDDHDRSSDGAEETMAPSFVYEYDDPPLRLPTHRQQASPRSPTAARERDSGRVKSLSLHHCKEFLLACANEIHELDSENPNFDYAEDTTSEPRTTHRGLLQLLDRRVHAPRTASRPADQRNSAPAFDYASTAGSSAVSVITEVDQDDVAADQGSEFSEVLRRADYLSDVDSDDLSSVASWSIPLADDCASSVRSFGGAARELQLQRRAFDALRQHGVEQTRARRAFQRMQCHAQHMRLKRLAMVKLRLATWPRRQLLAPAAPTSFSSDSRVRRAKLALSQHLDLLFVVLCAAAMQALGS